MTAFGKTEFMAKTLGPVDLSRLFLQRTFGHYLNKSYKAEALWHSYST
ncbi:MAG: hypothetical protein ACJAT8_000362 [Cellvibrionaceae bacterium]|jgi:hypothetical protein